MPDTEEILAAIDEALAAAEDDVKFEKIDMDYLVRAAATCQTS